MKKIIFFLCALVMIANCIFPRQNRNSFLGQSVPNKIPARFAKEIINDNFFPHSKLIISPAGDKIYWTSFLDTVNRDMALYYSEFDGKNLSSAKKDTTLGKYGIKSFIFSNEKRKILFPLNLPCEKLKGKTAHAICSSEQTDTGWSKPEPIESTIDTNWVSIGTVSINNKGDIYFSGRLRDETAKLYCSKYVNGRYQKYEPLPETINTGITLDSFIDSQDKYLLFAALRREDNIGIIDLYVSFKDEKNNWSVPKNLGENICTPFMDRFPLVTKDGPYLFFVTSHSNHFPSTHTFFYWVDAKIINELKPDNL